MLGALSALGAGKRLGAKDARKSIPDPILGTLEARLIYTIGACLLRG